MLKRFKSVSLMLLLMGLPTGLAMAETAPVDTYAVVQQNGPAKGTVLDANGEPLVGASVVVKGTTNGAMVDNDGNFTLTGVKAGQTLRITYVGYIAQEVVWNGTPVRVVLEEMQNGLGEVVVIGYGTVKKNDMTGSVVAIKAEETNRGVVTSPDQMLQGKVPGLLVTPASGDPTGSATIRVRGAASLFASNDPLIVIDGVPVTAEGGAGMANPLASINPNDIESFSILKDASATAIYGSRASNGVIIITTKKGKGDKIQFSYNSSYAAKQNTAALEVLTGDQYRELISKNYGGTEREAFMLANQGGKNTNWQDLIYQIGFTTDQNFSIYGNKRNFPFRVSLGYNYDNATLKVGDNRRTTLSASLSPKFFKEHLSVNANVKGINNKANYPNGGAVGDAVAFDPTQDPYFRTAEGAVDYSRPTRFWNWYASDGSANTMASINPLSQLYDPNNFNNAFRSLGNLQLDYKIHGFEDLRFNLNLGYDVAQTKGDTHNTQGGILAQRNAVEDYWNHYTNYSSNTLLEFYGNYNHEWEKHHLDVMAGYSWQHDYVKYNSTQYYNYFSTPDITDITSDDNIYKVAPQDAKEYYLVSFFGRANYSLLGRYLFTVTLRDDASSRFSPDTRWGLFPSAAFAWNIAEEKFIHNHDALTALKLRLGWGQTGQQDIGMNRCYAYQAKYTQSSALTMRIPWNGSWIYTLAPNAYNPNIKWETTETWNAGLDFGFWNNRINGNVDVYLRKTSDLLNEVHTPMGSNFSNVVIDNVGTMENKGIEFNLNVVPVQKENMRWTIGLNGTFQNVKITKLTSVPTADYVGVPVGPSMSSNEGNACLYRVGYTPYTYYLYQQAYDAQGNPLLNTFVDRNEDGKIDENDRYVTGRSITPKFFGGINSQFTYKHFDIGFNAHYSIGGYALNKVNCNNSTMYSDDYQKGYMSNFTTYVLKTGWTNNITDLQKYSDMYIENASFFRMDDINVGYTFENIPNFRGNVRLGLSVQNVFTISKYSGLDPEITDISGVDNNFIPRPRIYTLRLNVNF